MTEKIAISHDICRLPILFCMINFSTASHFQMASPVMTKYIFTVLMQLN